MSIENSYNKLDKQGKDKVILFIISQAILIILGGLLSLTIIVFFADSISLPVSKVILILIMMAICVAIYYRSIGSVNSNKED